MSFKKYLAKNTYPDPIGSPIVSGQGIYFTDAKGGEYMDFSSQTLNLLFGQTPPKIVEAIIDSMSVVSYASSRFSTSIYLETAERLSDISPIYPNRVNIKMCDGSDANETAIKTARKYTGKPGIISFTGMHTGQTTQTINIRGYGRNEQTLIGTTEEVYFVEPPRSNEEIFSTLLKIEQILVEHEIAAILLDPLFLNVGLLVFENSIKYFLEIENLCKKYQALFILDENQTFGWFESIFFSKEYNLSPDIITLGKGLTSGLLPLAGVIIKEYLDGVLDYNEADFTNGGNPSCCAACNQTIIELVNTDLAIKEKEKLIKDRILGLKEIFPNVEIRGIGIIWSFDFSNVDHYGTKTKELFENIFKKGIFLRRYGDIIIMKPPVIVTNEELVLAIDLISKSIGEIQWHTS